MRDAFGGLVNIVIIVVFIVVVSGYLAFNVTYTKAFKVKNKMISLLEQYEGKCGSTYANSRCNNTINEYVKNVGYSIPNMKKDGYDCDATPGLCIRKYDTQLNAGVKPDEQTDRQSFYYEVCASINVDIPIINRIMPNMRLFQVCGDTKQIVLTQ